jgi:hypothetical protein
MYLLAYFYYYFGGLRPVALFSYIIAAVRSVKLNRLDESTLIAAVIAGIKFLESIEQVGWVGIMYWRLYWGWIVFYLFFLANPTRRLKYVWVLPIITCVEYVLIQLFPSVSGILPNYNMTDFISYQDISGINSGVHSFGGNRTVTSVILAALYFDEKERKGKHQIYYFVATILAFSGLGTALLFLFLARDKFAASNQSILKRFIPTIFSICVLLILLFGEHGFERVKFSYLSGTIIGYKLDQIEEAKNLYDYTLRNFLFGEYVNNSSNQIVSDMGITFGDFLALQFAVDNGLLGIIAFALFVGSGVNKMNSVPIMIMLIGTFHYHVIFSLPGQIVFGYLLAKRRNCD